MSNDTFESKLAAYKASLPVKSWKVFYKRDVFNVFARDEAQIYAELETTLTNFKPQLASIKSNEEL